MRLDNGFRTARHRGLIHASKSLDNFLKRFADSTEIDGRP